MGIHDWTRVEAGVWHGFHLAWLAEFRRVLNGGLLPDGYYADAEQRAMGYEPDVLALEESSHELMGDAPDDQGNEDNEGDDDGGGGTATATLARPRMSVVAASDSAAWYASRRRTIAVRRANGDRLVAMLELASPGNKDRPAAVDAFAAKAADALRAGVHLAVLDLFPPRRFDGPGGLVGAVAEAAEFAPLALPAGRPLCVGSFEAGRPTRLYAEPLAVGDSPPPLPLFLAAGRWVDVPLADPYAAAWSATPRRWRDVIDAAPGGGGGPH